MARTPPASTHVLPGSPPVTVALRRSARAKRYSLRVSRSDGRVSLSLPLWAPEADALAFLQAREGWLRGHLARTPEARVAHIGAALPVGGRPHEIVTGAGRAARLVDGSIKVPPGLRQGVRIKVLLTGLAREALAAAVTRHAGAVGRAPGRLTLRDTRSRWGSCSSRGDLMFSWRLVMAPPDVLDYVAAHEVAHLVHMDHSPAFWALCAELCPEHRRHRDWLRREGADLLAWRFEDAGDGAGPC